jgi:hypothetical protein
MVAEALATVKVYGEAWAVTRLVVVAKPSGLFVKKE